MDLKCLSKHILLIPFTLSGSNYSECIQEEVDDDELAPLFSYS